MVPVILVVHASQKVPIQSLLLNVAFIKSNNLVWSMACFKRLTLKAPIPLNGQTHSNNSSATANELFECVWPFCKAGALRVNRLKHAID